MAFAIAEGIEGVAFKNMVDGAVVVITGLFVFVLVDGAARKEIGQHSWCRVGEHVTIGDMMTGLIGSDDDTRHHKRGASQLEEVVSGANLVHGQNVAVNLAEEFLDIVDRLHIFVVFRLNDRGRQGLTVHLLVLVQRDIVNLHGGSRNHVRRLLLTDESVQFLDVHLLVADNISGDELSTILIVKGLHGCILDAGELSNHGLHFLQLDAETTYLHLTVFTSHELDVAIGEITHDVAGAIHTAVLRVVAERILYVCLGSLFRTIQVAAAHLRSRNPQLAHGTDGQSIELLVNDIEP